MGYKTIYPVDVDGDFPFGIMVKAQDQYLASHTILETLLYMNADAKVADDMGFYFREAHLGEPGDWPGADLVSDWFRRNMRIYSKRHAAGGFSKRAHPGDLRERSSRLAAAHRRE